jgi:hypothetical protein
VDDPPRPRLGTGDVGADDLGVLGLEAFLGFALELDRAQVLRREVRRVVAADRMRRG